MENIIRIAVQKSGRLSEDSLSLIKECGIKFYNGTGKLKSTSTNFPIEFLFLRDDDIPGYVADGVADLGIVGENELVEKNKEVNTLKKLGFSKCRLSLAIPKGQDYPGLSFFDGKSIATSYPKILGDFLKSKNLQAEIHEISGSVEIAPSIGLAEAICDIVSSGSTLMMNGLKEVEQIFKSEAVLISNKNLSPEKLSIVDKLLFRMNAVQTGKSNKYVLLNAPNHSLDKIISLIPGMRSPTILPLAQEGWSSVHSVLSEEQFWENIEGLRAAGAEGILVVPIEKMVV
ncbi:ATP phosphoribosyltransferase [Rhodonellum psychrophilum GCM71 = DSM 17998]|uniref:ATP phosphoribosyltransferase n=2 Tax=Rhodonellum TaxID=336827 RepID=U5BYI0_9BACT|nr:MULTISPECIES: ATP phosphoribosyltransferase [Rhodonellum]ERM80952.1 ATP phosphoribosyltransferase [Rhodonellum psychrophilum GCM71 = DSM 17998]MDO9554750.1 ATP phosphoribosyltransferase [Rhodonellum sp.]SDY82523.1 ATP phosphoribosyltransferase [Rhodonellum ikkaensis]